MANEQEGDVASNVRAASGEYASRQHGVVSRRQLTAAGISRTTIDRRMHDFLIPLFPGVFAVGRRQVDRDGILIASVLLCGDGAVLGYRTAAEVWGFLSPNRSVEVIRPWSRSNTRANVEIDGTEMSIPLVVRRTRNLPGNDWTCIRGIPVTSVARTFLDLAAILSEPALRRAFLEADRLGLVIDADFMDCLARSSGRKGASRFRRLISQRIPEVDELESVLQGMFLELCRDHGISRPRVEVPIDKYRVDCLWKAERLVVELDGGGFHRGQEKLENDTRRTNRLRTEGWDVIRFTWRMVRYEPELVVGQVKHALQVNATDVSRRVAAKSGGDPHA